MCNTTHDIKNRKSHFICVHEGLPSISDLYTNESRYIFQAIEILQFEVSISSVRKKLISFYKLVQNTALPKPNTESSLQHNPPQSNIIASSDNDKFRAMKLSSPKM